MPDLLLLFILALVGLVAGFVDAIAGGGGLVALPALLSVGFSPIGAIATNKLQGAIGTSIAAMTYWRKGLVEVKPLVPAIIATYVGSISGAFTVQRIDTSHLAVAVPIALIAISAYFLFAPKLTDADRHARLGYARFVPLMGLVIGFYDGVFGPGTGSFLTLGFIMLFGLGVTKAAAHTKILNLVSNLAALTLFIPSGNVIWPAAIAMAVGQIAGGYLGALTGIRFGAKVIRPLVVIVSIILALRLLITGHS
ncbi:MAG TPA: TSUP family transporter [Devosiaceae bacterium]|nr:TSUP family transporter [Devosiaceae bacterium]